jgi:nucleoside-diphosphate-sugar epimerase
MKAEKPDRQDENSILWDDLKAIISDESIAWSSFHDKTILVTGATGMIGSLLVKALAWRSIYYKTDIRIIATVRSPSSAQALFAAILQAGASLEFLQWDAREQLETDKGIDFIVHGAAVTSSKQYIQEPLQTIMTTIEGTISTLELAQKKNISSMVYLSSMEVYGESDSNRKITENDFFSLDCASVRSSYSESKRIAETLCVAYWKDRSVPVMIARLAQTFGAGMKLSDNRIYAEFARCALNQNDIRLMTKGESAHSFVYTADAAAALLTLLSKGEPGLAYNIANEDSYTSMREMAELVCREQGIGLQVLDTDSASSARGFAPPHKMNLDATRLKNLGWTAKVSLRDMYRRLIAYLSEEGER